MSEGRAIEGELAELAKAARIRGPYLKAANGLASLAKSKSDAALIVALLIELRASQEFEQ